MSEAIIQVENLGKRYQIKHQSGERYTALRDVLARKLKNLLPGSRNTHQASTSEDFWALKDVSFQVNEGEVVGIIGRNGAGKSTLLKILSRITEPTTGRITLGGRVASLLEVGTGFHPELTGRENIFLNGAILGMTKGEIRRKFDEIVAFAEVEKFLDTPVKRYSSGMYVRLAFAVAAHLEPEILVVDEVLAVGDAEFQKKCLGKMSEVARGGRTVLFVSHHMPSIQRLCSHAILLDQGRVCVSGDTKVVIQNYLSGAQQIASSVDLTTLPRGRRRGSGTARFQSVELLNFEGRPTQEFSQGEPIKVRFTILAKQKLENVAFGFSFISRDGVEIMGSAAHDGGVPSTLKEGLSTFQCDVVPMVLCPGTYTVRGAIFVPSEVMDHIDEMLGFEIHNTAVNPEVAPRGHIVGHVYLPYRWSELFEQR